MSLSCLANVKRDENGNRPQVPPNTVFATYVGDRSGSMEGQSKASANGVYEWVKEMCSGVLNNGQNGFITVTFFDNETECRMNNIPMKDVVISMDDARDWSCPRGMTKLYDTAIMEINQLRRRIKTHKESHPNEKVHGVFQLFSDGYDNESIASEDMLQAAIESAKKEGISCIYLGIGQDAIQMGQKYGFNAETSLSADIGELTSQIAFRGCSLNALRCATSGTTPAMPEMLRQRSAPAQFNNSGDISPLNLNQGLFPMPNLRQSAIPVPSISLRSAPMSMLNNPALAAANLRQPACKN